MSVILLSLLAYLFGSLPFGKVAGYYHGLDIQRQGSGNIGFANAVRVLGWPTGLLVLLGDVCKGLLPVLLAREYITGPGLMFVGLTAIVGHIFPVWLRGKGGKGIATGLGVSLGISPLLGLLGLATYLVCIIAIRKSAPSSVIGAWSMPFWCLALGLGSYSLFYAALAVLALWTHRSNLRRLLRFANAS
jgi:glycerol-3-phosphate acyltransferase PlsY